MVDALLDVDGVRSTGFSSVVSVMIGHLSGEMMLIKHEPPAAASFESDVGWHTRGLLASVTVTSRAHGRSTFVVVERHKTDARELQIGHALLSFFSAPVIACSFRRVAIKGKDPMTPQLWRSIFSPAERRFQPRIRRKRLK